MKTYIVQTLSGFVGGQLDLKVNNPYWKAPKSEEELFEAMEYSAPSYSFVLDDPDNWQLSKPVQARSKALKGYEVFVFRNRVVVVEPPYELSQDEIILAVKHTVLSQEQALADLRNDIKRFERLKDADGTLREPIPAEVRSFVWRRDQGRCVRCGGSERLEFDHIIALANGGGNTERNIQLLCEACNRAKGTTI